MTPISTRIVARRSALLALSACLLTLCYVAAAARLTPVRAQTGNNATKAEKPPYHDYKGIEIGMSQDEVRKKLGSPKDKDEAQDFYLFSEKETAQIYYQNKKVFAVSVSYMGDKTGAPGPKSVVGTEIQAAADGRLYKLVRYPDAGYWVSYSRIAGDEPMVTVTMQRLQ
jgi:outer membrane protein assembly factor BamE (lipoprotein component of BamABCDE complex)